MNTAIKKSAIGVAASILVSVSSFGQSIVYDNSSTYLNTQTALGNGQHGDNITLAGTDRVMTGFQFEYFVGATTAATGQLFIRALDGSAPEGGPNNAPGTVLYQSAPFSLTPGFHTFNGTGMNVNLAGRTEVAWTVDFTGIDAGETAGLLFYNPPTIGNSADSFWRFNAPGSPGWSLFDTPGIVDNFGARLTAIPEPSTWAMMIGGLGMLAARAFRRKA